MDKNKENKTSDVQVNYNLKEICEKADGRLLINYIAQNKNKKEGETLRKELSVAFSNDPDVVKLAMKALESFDFSHDANRRVCIFLLESLFPIFGNDARADVPLDVKDSAREIAKLWRNLIKKKRGLDNQAFLQLLISFRIATDYEKDELLEMLFPVSIYSKAPEMCRSLGLSPDADFIDKVSNTYGPFRAIKVALAFGMMDKIDPAGLLTSLLIDVEKDITEMRALEPDASQLLWTKADSKKLGVLRSVFNLIEMYGLQCDSFKADMLKEIKNLELEKMYRRKKAAEKRQQEDRKKVAEKKAQKKAPKKKAQEKEDKKEASAKKVQRSDGLSESENYALKRAKHASLNETTRVAGGTDIIGHNHHPSAFSAANRSSTGLAAGAFTSALSMAAQLNDARRRHEGYLSVLGTSNVTPIGSSLYSYGVPAGAFSVPLSNVAEVNYEGRAEQSYMSNFGEVDKNHVRASVYGTGDLTKSSATESIYNFEGRGLQSYKLNFGEIGNNPVTANSSATKCHYERSGPELYTSTLGGGLTGSIGSSVYGSNPRTVPSSGVNQGSYESGLEQHSGFAGRNMVPGVSSGYGTSVSTVPLSGFAGRNMVPGVSSGYGTSVSTVPPSGFAGRNMVPVVSSGYGSSVSRVPPSGFAGRNMVPFVSSGYGSTVFTVPPTCFAGRNMVPVVSSGYGSSVSTVPPSGFAGRNTVPVVSSGYGSSVSTVLSGFAGRNMVPVVSSGYGSSVSTVPPSGFAGRHMVPVVSSGYGSSVSTVPPSGFAGRNTLPVVSSGYGSSVSTVPPTSVTEGHFERRRSVVDKYQFNIG